MRWPRALMHRLTGTSPACGSRTRRRASTTLVFRHTEIEKMVTKKERETWTLFDDGKTLTRKTYRPRGEQTYVFERTEAMSVHGIRRERLHQRSRPLRTICSRGSQWCRRSGAWYSPVRRGDGWRRLYPLASGDHYM